MTYGYEQALARRAADTSPVLAGGSGYFAHRGTGLDPALFEYNDHLRAPVRAMVLAKFNNWATEHGLNQPWKWCTLWLAGSGITRGIVGVLKRREKRASGQARLDQQRGVQRVGRAALGALLGVDAVDSKMKPALRPQPVDM